MEAKGFRAETRQVIQVAFSNTGDLDCISAWLEVDDKLFKAQDRARKSNIPPEGRPTIPLPPIRKPTIKQVLAGAVIGHAGDLATLPASLLASLLLQQAQEHRGLMVADHLEHLVPVPDLKPVQDTLETYDFIKGSQTALASLISKSVQDGNKFQLEKLVQLSARQKAFQQDIIAARCDYVSFAVVRPYLIRAAQLTFVSRLESATFPLGHSRPRLKEAAVTISRVLGTSTGILAETDEEVRQQFIRVWKEIRDTAGKEEFEELKVVQTLSDSLQSEKQSGANKWWPK